MVQFQRIHNMVGGSKERQWKNKENHIWVTGPFCRRPLHWQCNRSQTSLLIPPVRTKLRQPVFMVAPIWPQWPRPLHPRAHASLMQHNLLCYSFKDHVHHTHTYTHTVSQTRLHGGYAWRHLQFYQILFLWTSHNRANAWHLFIYKTFTVD